MEEFQREYATPPHTQPVIIRGGATHWPALRWTRELLLERCGGGAPVDNAKELAPPSRVSSFGNMLLNVGARKHGRESLGDVLQAQVGGSPRTYLHDQSIQSMCPQLLRDIRVPRFFPCNLGLVIPDEAVQHPVHNHPSLFVSTSAAYSPLHVDQLGSRFWMAVLRGTKRWVLFAPNETSLLYPKDEASAVPGEFNAPILQPDTSAFPSVSQATAYVGDVHAGDLVFVPEGWPHEVANVPGNGIEWAHPTPSAGDEASSVPPWVVPAQPADAVDATIAVAYNYFDTLSFPKQVEWLDHYLGELDEVSPGRAPDSWFDEVRAMFSRDDWPPACPDVTDFAARDHDLGALDEGEMEAYWAHEPDAGEAQAVASAAQRPPHESAAAVDNTWASFFGAHRASVFASPAFEFNSTRSHSGTAQLRWVTEAARSAGIHDIGALKAEAENWRADHAQRRHSRRRERAALHANAPDDVGGGGGGDDDRDGDASHGDAKRASYRQRRRDRAARRLESRERQRGNIGQQKRHSSASDTPAAAKTARDGVDDDSGVRRAEL